MQDSVVSSKNEIQSQGGIFLPRMRKSVVYLYTKRKKEVED